MKGTLRPFSVHSIRGADGAIPLLTSHTGVKARRVWGTKGQDSNNAGSADKR